MNINDPDWETLKLSKPTLSPSLEFESRTERDQSWLIIRNTISGEHVRLNASAADFFMLIDGHKTLEELYSTGNELGLSVSDVSELIPPLCASGIIALGSPNEQKRLLEQFHAHEKMEKRSRFSNPLSIKFPLHNPDKWLGVVVEKTHRFVGSWMLVLSVTLIALAFSAFLVNRGAVVAEFSRVAASPAHWWLYGLLYPALKAIHEFSHAFAIKRWGGTVHEFGISLLVLMPIPYVDASDSWMFPTRTKRILVSAAGMLVECTLAAIGLFVFLTVQPGFAKELGFAIFVMGSLSTILFNANPLLRFDGYYILQDLLNIPNLATRAMAYCRYLARKYLFHVKDARSPVRAPGEHRWLLVYGVLATAYRCFITVVIALFLTSQFLVLGLALALFAFFQLLINPVIRLINYLRHSPELHDRRGRAMGVALGITGAALIFVVLLPMPSSTRAQGVVWVPNQAQVFAAEEGVVSEVLVESGQLVQAGQTLFRLGAPELHTALQVAEAELTSSRVMYQTMQRQDTVKAQAIESDIKTLEAAVDQMQRRNAELEIKAQGDGQFFIVERKLVLGQFVRKGDLLAYVVNKSELVVKAVLKQQRIERIQAGVHQAQVRLSNQFSTAVDATLTRQTPTASNSLPSPALAYDGRSGIAVASENNDQLKTIERVFHIELSLPDTTRVAGIGGKAYVTLHHQPESLGKRWWRSTRQLLLKQLTV